MPAWIVSLPDRLDAFLAKQGAALSRAKVQAAVEDGRVTVNEIVVTKPAHRLQEGDKVTMAESENAEAEREGQAVDMHLTVLHEDDTCMVIDKPAGIAVHPGAGMAPDEKTLLDGLAWLFRKKKLAYRDDAVLVHRLDRETTGCILVAKTPEAHRALQAQFETRTVKKTYLAIVAGVPDPAAAVIDAPIGRSTVNRTKMAVLGSSATREAQTTYRTLSATKESALLACDLHTGRTHQIRIHLQTIGHPILGDGTYHNELSDRLSQRYGVGNLCLHAWKLSFRSPAGGKDRHVESPLPPAFGETIKTMGLSLPE